MQTQSKLMSSSTSADSIVAQLAAIASKLESMESLKEDIATLRHQATSLAKPRSDQSSDEYLCSIKQTGTVHDYRKEFARRSVRVSNWPENCLLGVFLNGLKEDLKADVRIHKPRTVYDAMSLALELESKIGHHRPTKTLSSTSAFKPNSPPVSPSSTLPDRNTPSILETEKQGQYPRGECFKSIDKYDSGHLYKVDTFKLLKSGEEAEDAELARTPVTEGDTPDNTKIVKIRLCAIPKAIETQSAICNIQCLQMADFGDPQEVKNCVDSSFPCWVVTVTNRLQQSPDTSLDNGTMLGF